MLNELLLFTGKLAIFLIFIISFLMLVLTLFAKTKEKLKEKLQIKNLSQLYAETKEKWLAETLSKKALKAFHKEKKINDKEVKKNDAPKKSIFVISFCGDLKASAVTGLSEMITAILQVATSEDEVVLRLESPGGVVHGYGLAAAQLMRLRAQHIHLTVAVDKIAASGGYMMACVANKIIAAPFAIIGSIGVIVQLPNFHSLLKDKKVDFEQHTAGEFKRTITVFGENTNAGREKLHQEIEDVHGLFKKIIKEHREYIDLSKVATGEHWYGQQALHLRLIDEIKTSDDLLLELNRDAILYEVSYTTPKSFLSKLLGQAQEKLSMFIMKLF
jgi:serine protease SohB